MKKCPCKGCEKRTITCHGFCRDYQEFRAERDEINRKKNDELNGRPFSHDLEMKYRKNLKSRRKRA